MGGALLFQSLALQSMASQFSTSEGIGKILARMEQKFNVKFGYDASISQQKINAEVDVNRLKKDQIVQFIFPTEILRLRKLMINSTLFRRGIALVERVLLYQQVPKRKCVAKL